MKKYVPTYDGTLRKHALTVPHCISKCSGIRVFGRRIKSLVFSTDVAIIKNINADAIIAVYPFTPQAGITQAIIGVQMASTYIGTCLMPPLFGLLANHISIRLLPWFLLILLALMVHMHETLERKAA